jgi:hypothetical protein
LRLAEDDGLDDTAMTAMQLVADYFRLSKDASQIAS